MLGEREKGERGSSVLMFQLLSIYLVSSFFLFYLPSIALNEDIKQAKKITI